MKERLEKLKILLEELQNHSHADQYGIADLVETNPKLKERMNTLASESEFYQNSLDKIDKLCKFKQ